MVLKVKNDDQSIIEGIIKNDSDVIRSIYKSEYERIKNMVTGFGNIGILPEDVFQEGLTRAVINIKNGKFHGTSSFSTYLYGICRNLCLKAYNQKSPLTGIELKDIKENYEEEYFDEINLIIKLKEQLDEQCRKIIDLRFGIIKTKQNSTRFDAVASFLGISGDNARQRFRRCFAKLKAMALNNSEIKQLIQ